MLTEKITVKFYDKWADAYEHNVTMQSEWSVGGYMRIYKEFGYKCLNQFIEKACNVAEVLSISDYGKSGCIEAEFHIGDNEYYIELSDLELLIYDDNLEV